MGFITSLVFAVLCFESIQCDWDNNQEVSSRRGDGTDLCYSEYLFPQFPECKEYEDLIREKIEELRRNGEIGYCDDQSPMECLRNETIYARDRMTTFPPIDCMEPLLDFLFGSTDPDYASKYISEDSSEYDENILR
ncbi:uncharacterized protein NPIL_704201 [Nephila pilipes]|uniref:Venom protein n=1 Tax=Nephila pilipes TaxID=299642 RepID=A0A8X6TR63_NEPPI|nr:uncharacterized protein NPIL_704201 [Nephila pilipes]